MVWHRLARHVINDLSDNLHCRHYSIVVALTMPKIVSGM